MALSSGLAAQLIGLLLIIIAEEIRSILVGGFFVALGMAMIGSTSTALALDLANPGPLADLVGLRGMYLGSVVITLTGLTVLGCAWKSLLRPGGK